MSNFFQTNLKPKILDNFNPKIGLIALSTDFTIERDFRNVCSNQNIDIYVNRIPFKNPLNRENYLDMSNFLPEIANNILPGEKIDCIAYGCTSGTVAIGDKIINEKIRESKPEAYVSTPINAAIKSFTKMNIKKISILTPYPKEVNETIFEYFIKNNIEIKNFISFNLDFDKDIANVDPAYLLETIKDIKYKDSDAIFISCTALRALEILNQAEIETGKYIISSNQALIWDCLRSIKMNKNIEGFGKLFLNK
tara:strand:- start:4495 stop:5250 length:756 start_codon:yes stop_codon:yes gene_type:complete